MAHIFLCVPINVSHLTVVIMFRSLPSWLFPARYATLELMKITAQYFMDIGVAKSIMLKIIGYEHICEWNDIKLGHDSLFSDANHNES